MDLLREVLLGMIPAQRASLLLKYAKAFVKSGGAHHRTGRMDKDSPMKRDYTPTPLSDPLAEAARKGKLIVSVEAMPAIHSDEESEFLKALLAYKTKYHRESPTMCEVLAVLKSVGYSKAVR